MLDALVSSLGGAAFWLIVSVLSQPSDIGYATTMISLVGLLGGILGLGFDYALLHEVARGGAKIYGTSLILEITLILVSLPIVILTGSHIYGGEISRYVAMSVVLLLSAGVLLISKFSLLGVFMGKSVFLIDLFSTVIRLCIAAVGLLLGSNGYSILLAMAVQNILAGGLMTVICLKCVGFKFESSIVKRVLRLAISNFPLKGMNILAGTLSVVLYAEYIGDSSAVGSFYIALTVSLIVTSIATSFSIMALPTSFLKGEDSSISSFRLGICTAVPIVAILVSTPKLVLGTIGKGFIPAYGELIILALAVLPNIIVINAATKLNHLKCLHQLIALGLIQMLSFIASFFLLLHSMGAIGISLAILISNLMAAGPALVWQRTHVIKPLMIALLSLALGSVSGIFFSQYSMFIGAVMSLMTSLLLIILMKGIYVAEIKKIFATVASIHK